MKKILGVLIAVVGLTCFSGCDVYGLIREPEMNFTSLSEALAWVSSNIEYKSDAGGFGYWQAPQETIDKKTGDCEDFAILLGYYAEQLGYDVKIEVVKRIDGVDHALCLIENKRYDAELGDIFHENVLFSWYTITLRQALERCVFINGSRNVN